MQSKITLSINAIIILLFFNFIPINVSADTILFNDWTNVAGEGIYDSTGTIRQGDVDTVQLDFSSVTGDYTVTWTAFYNDPFNGDLDLWLNLRNITNPTLSLLPIQFSHTLTSVTNQAAISYSGNHQELLDWSVGDEVITQLSYTGGGWGSMLHVTGDVASSWPFVDRIDRTDQQLLITSSSYAGTGSAVPEPATMFLFGFGLLGLAGVGRKKS